MRPEPPRPASEIMKSIGVLERERAALIEDQEAIASALTHLQKLERKAARSFSDSAIKFDGPGEPGDALREARRAIAALDQFTATVTDDPTIPRMLITALGDVPKVMRMMNGEMLTAWPRCLTPRRRTVEQVDEEIAALEAEAELWRRGPGPKRKWRVVRGCVSTWAADGKPRTIRAGGVVEMDAWVALSHAHQIEPLEPETTEAS